MSTQTISSPSSRPDAASFRKVELLVGAYFAISALALAAIIVISDVFGGLSAAVWTHGIIVTAGAAAVFAAAVRAAHGSRWAYRRLQVASVLLVTAVVAVIVLPGFPVWMKAEQGVAGLCMIAVAVLVNGSHRRSLIAAR